MNSETIQIHSATHAKLKRMAELAGESFTELLDKAVEAYRRQRFLAKCDAEYGQLRADPAAWSAEQSERQKWDTALGDGVEDEV